MLVFWIIVGVVVYHFAPTDRIRSDWFPVALAICILGFLAWVWMNDRWRDRYRIRERVDAVQWLNAERYLRLRRYFPAHLPYLGYPRTFEWVCEASEYFDVRSSQEGSG